MTSHVWGDGFDFEGLNNVGRYLGKFYAELSGRRMYWKEKYGTIRYEFTCFWVETEQEFLWFDEALRKTIQQYPEMAGEIADDLSWFFPDSMNHLNSFYEGVVFLHDALNKDTDYDSTSA